jgi:[protein-PII] uridylyltransferase
MAASVQTFYSDDISKSGELRTHREILEIFWRKGISGSALLHENTSLIDSNLQQNFLNCPNTEGMALVALGGYGRRELFPFSDIDILLLHEPSAKKNLAPATESLFYPLWDAGLEVGHSVRTIKTCIKDAQKDFFFQVALLDARFIAGSQKLFTGLTEAYQKKFVHGRRLEFLNEMTFHRNERHRRFGQHSYQLEPQIKESRGGLRDVQAMIWTARFVFGLKDLADMTEAGLLTDIEHKNFLKAWNHLIKIRNRLHYISGRKNDRLFFEHQEEIAKAFKYRDQQNHLAVEMFMRDVYDHMQTISTCSDLFFEHAHEVIGQGHLSSNEGLREDRQLEAGLGIRKGFIYLANQAALEQRPDLLMRVFFHAAKLGLQIHYQTRKLINSSLGLVNESFQTSPGIGKLFLQLLMEKNSRAALEIMLESGFLAAYIPEFAFLKSRAQHDVYHVYTVDHHQVQTVAALAALRKEQKEIMSHISAPHLLFLGALIHDIGKGRGLDHSEIGAELACGIGQRLGLSKAEGETLSFLVKRHLFLTETAMHRDLEDAVLIRRCSAVIDNIDKLSMLYLLSIADAKSTGPTVWSDWKGALLLELYLKIALTLDEAAPDPVEIQQGLVWIQEKIQQSLPAQTFYDVETLPEDYLLSFSPEEIADHILKSQRLKGDEVLCFPHKKDNFFTLLIITGDRPALLSKICGVLALHNLKVLAAKIFTLPDGTAVDSLDVQSVYPEEDVACDWDRLREDLELAVTFRLGLEHRLSKKSLYPIRSSSKKMPQHSVKVNFDNESSDAFTIIEVYAHDRPGLLYLITRTLSYFHISIFRAKIGSHSDQVVDVFYVLDQNNNKLTEAFLIEEIRMSLTHAASSA